MILRSFTTIVGLIALLLKEAQKIQGLDHKEHHLRTIVYIICRERHPRFFVFLFLTVWLLTEWHMNDIIESSGYKGLHRLVLKTCFPWDHLDLTCSFSAWGACLIFTTFNLRPFISIWLDCRLGTEKYRSDISFSELN